MKTHILQALKLNLFYAETNLLDLTDEQMTTIPDGLKNHPAWLVGHILGAYGFAFEAFEAPQALPDGWAELFGMGSTARANGYPTKDELLEALRGAHAHLTELIEDSSEAQLDAPSDEDSPLHAMFPRVGDVVVGASLVHEAVHLGQLSAWRVAMGLPLAF